LICPPFALMTAALELAWTPEDFVKPDDHVLQHDLRMIQEHLVPKCKNILPFVENNSHSQFGIFAH